uniref:SH2 domain-containing protein n=1 Tax=Trichuris muris TaxID=70415 RepID=A0A5S6QR41_TRIMR
MYFSKTPLQLIPKKKPERRPSDGRWSFLSRAKASKHADDCGLLGDLPGRPLHALPYFHGVLTVAEIGQLGLVAGEFLIFLNKDRKLETTLAVMDEEGELICKVIHQNKGHYFWIRPEDQNLRFSIIEHLIVYYITYKEKIEKNAGFFTILRKPTQNSSLVQELLVEACEATTCLSYCYGKLSDGDVANLLVEDGDYLIREVSLEGGSAFQVCVFWDKVVKMAMTTSDLPDELLLLPRASEYEPTEGVSQLDHLLKSLVAGKCVVDGVQFKHAVCDSKRKETQCQREAAAKMARMVAFEEAAETTAWLKLPNRQFSLLNHRAPRPLHLLSYYHGVITEAKANSQLSCVGDFLVYINVNTEQLYVAAYEHIQNLQIWWHVNIFCSAGTGYFWIRPEDEQEKFTCVELLIAYYQKTQTPLKSVSVIEQLKDEQAGDLFCITTPVTSPDYGKHVNVQYTDCAEELSYHFGNISDKKVDRLLKNYGDYLLRNNEFGQPFLSIRWGDKVVNHQIPYNSAIGRTVLPRKSEAEPVESIFSIDQYVKSLVRCQHSVDGAVPKTAIHERPRRS